MSFDELLLSEDPLFKLCDFIKLCINADDDKVYIDIDTFDNSVEFTDVRVIDPILQPYYTWYIKGIYEANRTVLILEKSS